MTDYPLTRTYPDGHGVEITFYVWPIEKPKAIVQIAHGLGDHARRYDHLAEALNKAGYSVYADDHRGHGVTGKKQVASGQTKTMGNLGPGGIKAAFEQVHEFTNLIKAENPGMKVVLFGHSYGSFIAQKLVNLYSDEYDAVILSGSSLLVPGVLGAGAFNKKWAKEKDATGYEWLSRDKEVGRKFAADEYTFLADAAKVLGIPNGLQLFFTPKKSIRQDLPLLIQAGSEDPIGGTRGNEMLANTYRNKCGLDNVTAIIYHEGRHEMYNETNKDEVIKDLLAFIKANVA
ncbi:MAG: alpha/beta hydrolase [Actinobacteria bacterium]|nr:alpha/beta hydrolase [Actinomycetota bacterium]